MQEFSIGEGLDALDLQNMRRRMDGYATVSGLGVSAGTGLAVDVASGTAAVGETSGDVDTVSPGSTSVSLASADPDDPRKDTVYVDESGTVSVETGVPAPAEPSGNVRFETYDPAPPIPTANGAILAQVWVPAGATSLSSSDILDMRLPAQAVYDTATIRNAEIEQLGRTLDANDNDVTNVGALDADSGTVDTLEAGSVNTDEVSIGSGHETVKPSEGAVGIKNAVDDLPASGGVIDLVAGDYNFDWLDDGESPILIDKSNVWLRGQGSTVSRIFLEDNSTNTDEGAKILDVHADNCVVSNLQIDGNWHNNDPGETGTVEDGHNWQVKSANFRAWDVWSRRSTGDGLELNEGATDVQVWGLKLEDNWEHGLGINGAQGVHASNLILDSEENEALIDTWNGSGNADTEDVKLTHLTLRNPQTDALRIRGGDGAVHDVTVRDVDIYGVSGTTRKGLLIQPGSGQTYVEDVDVSDVRIYDAKKGVEAETCQDVTLENVKTVRTQEPGISCPGSPHKGLTIRDCEVVDANQAESGNDALVLSTSASSERITVENNVVRSTGSPYPSNAIQFGGGGSYSETYCRDNLLHDFQDSRILIGPQITERRRNGTGVLEESGTVVASGDGTATTFTLSHALSTPPEDYSVTARSADASGPFYVSNVGAANLQVTYDSAPPSGTDNLEWDYWVQSN